VKASGFAFAVPPYGYLEEGQRAAARMYVKCTAVRFALHVPCGDRYSEAPAPMAHQINPYKKVFIDARKCLLCARLKSNLSRDILPLSQPGIPVYAITKEGEIHWFCARALCA